MKKLLLLLTIALTLSCCNNDDDSGSSLPPETQTGANTVGCLVNGKVFLPHQEGLSPSVNCFYQFVDGEFFFTMAFSDLRGGGVESVSIQTGRITLQANQTYILNKNSFDDGDFTGGGGSYFPTLSNIYSTTIIKTGELTITRVDLSNSIISGTFWYDAINSEGVVVEIREGRFDWNY